MSFANILYTFGKALAILSVMMVLPLVAAAASGDARNVRAFGEGLLFSGFIAGLLILGLRGIRRRGGPREAVLFVPILWVGGVFFAAVPLYLGGSTAMDAVFEATSGLTTTGATLYDQVSELPRAIILWRALLQWAGGYITILVAITVFSVLSFFKLPVQHATLPGSDRMSAVDWLAPLSRQVFSVYTLFTLSCFFLYWFDWFGLSESVPRFEAFCLALSTVSTGGFMTRDGSFSSYEGVGPEFVAVVFMILGALSFVLHLDAGRGRWRQYGRDPEVGHFFALALLFAFLFFLTGVAGSDQSRRFFSDLFNAVSLLTTTGYVIGEGDPLDGVPPALILFAVLVGGSALSTAGGVKLIRMILLVRQSLAELARLAHPHSVVRLNYGRRVVADEVYGGLWAYFVCLTGLLGAVAICVSLAGHDFETSLAASVTILSNAGPAFTQVTGGNVSFAGFPEPLKAVLSLAMVLGRIEILILLPLFDRSYWRA